MNNYIKIVWYRSNQIISRKNADVIDISLTVLHCCFSVILDTSDFINIIWYYFYYLKWFSVVNGGLSIIL